MCNIFDVVSSSRVLSRARVEECFFAAVVNFFCEVYFLSRQESRRSRKSAIGCGEGDGCLR